MYTLPPNSPCERGIFCNRTLNLRNIKAVGYDMDYTLIHYHVEAWEGRAYDHMKKHFLSIGWPVEHLQFEPDWGTRGLVIDRKKGNVLKVNRFGYVKAAAHGRRMLSYKEMRKAYEQTYVSLSKKRFRFLNTFFSLSEVCFYTQLVDLLDNGSLPEFISYEDLFEKVRKALDHAHVEGELKADIMADPAKYVELDPGVAMALLDQRMSGKKVMLITNSGWTYTSFMMSYAIQPYLPEGMSWQELFDLVVVSARKPDFFSGNSPAFEVVNEEGLLKPAIGGMEVGKKYLGGNAVQVEECLGLSGDHILYVGDHIFGDVNVSKQLLRWRAALILRELEPELAALSATARQKAELQTLMHQKSKLESQRAQLRLSILRKSNEYGQQREESVEELQKQLAELEADIFTIDEKVTPLAIEQSQQVNANWGYLLRTGNDQSHLCRQIERYADLYTSRVSNFLAYTPYAYFRAPHESLSHDPVYAVED